MPTQLLRDLNAPLLLVAVVGVRQHDDVPYAVGRLGQHPAHRHLQTAAHEDPAPCAVHLLQHGDDWLALADGENCARRLTRPLPMTALKLPPVATERVESRARHIGQQPVRPVAADNHPEAVNRAQHLQRL
jgi:hypothetical protein